MNVSDAWFHRIKSATRDLVRLTGGVERAAGVAGLSKSEVSRMQDSGQASIITIPAALALEAECGVAAVTAVMADIGGRRLSEPEAEARAAVSLLTANAEVLRRVGEVAAQLAGAAADGKITPSEAEMVDRAAGQAAEALARMRAGLGEAKAAGGEVVSLFGGAK